MNTFPLLSAALKGLGVPAEPLTYTGNAPEYMVYNDADNRPTLFGDGTDVADSAHVQVHFYTKEKHHIRMMQAKIKAALREHDFAVTGMETFYEDDTGFYHAAVTASIDGFPDGCEEMNETGG